MIRVLLAVALMASTLAWMIHLTNDHHAHRAVVHVARWAVIPAGIFASAYLAVHGLATLQNGLPL